jgi:hypothetical protein
VCVLQRELDDDVDVVAALVNVVELSVHGQERATMAENARPWFLDGLCHLIRSAVGVPNRLVDE